MRSYQIKTYAGSEMYSRGFVVNPITESKISAMIDVSEEPPVNILTIKGISSSWKVYEGMPLIIELDDKVEFVKVLNSFKKPGYFGFGMKALTVEKIDNLEFIKKIENKKKSKEKKS